MAKRTVTRPAHKARKTTARRRVHREPAISAPAESEPQIAGGGGSSGRGPFEDDGGGRKPERPNNGRARLLIALGILAVGAGVMTTRLLANASRRRG